MLDGLMDGLMAVGTGGLSGLIGGVLNKWSDYKLEKLRMEHQEKENSHELKVMAAEAEYNLKATAEKGRVDVAITEKEMESEVVKADAGTMKASFESDKRTYSSDGTSSWFVAVDVWRGVIRPLLTTYYSVVSVYLTYLLFDVLDGKLDEKMAGEMLNALVLLIMYMTATSTLYWFATRVKAPKGLLG